MNIFKEGVGCVCNSVGTLPCLQARSSWLDPSTYKGGMETHICILSAWEAEVKGGGVQGHPRLYDEFKASLGYKRLSQKMSVVLFCQEGLKNLAGFWIAS